ncbi:MAG TPA: hypothetical protein VM008_02865 [Phycisphaerae bacterium]|nr:hypothetical protein [Phycisphaerae bacterium]
MMLGVLCGLFAGSMAFADYLVVRQEHQGHVVPVLEKLGFTKEEEKSIQDEIASRSGTVEGKPRFVEVFAWKGSQRRSPRELVGEAARLFKDLTEGSPETTGFELIAKVPGVEVSGKDDDGQFTILRLAVIGTETVAISYSGPLPRTDADTSTFNAICATGIELRK